jgi:hypothetical protein
MTNDQQALNEMPVWMVILLSQVGGISGKAWRADKRQIGTDLFLFRPKPRSLPNTTPHAGSQARSRANCGPEVTRVHMRCNYPEIPDS